MKSINFVLLVVSFKTKFHAVQKQLPFNLCGFSYGVMHSYCACADRPTVCTIKLCNDFLNNSRSCRFRVIDCLTY